MKSVFTRQLACFAVSLVLGACSPSVGGDTRGDDRRADGAQIAGDQSPADSASGDSATGDSALPCLADSFLVTRIIDGDTIVLAMPHGTETIRIKGIDTPEISPPPEECAEAAQAFAFAQIGTGTAARVQLVYNSDCSSDPLVQCRDPFNRLLAYVRLTNCEDLGGLLLEAGLARVFRAFPFDRRDAYDLLEAAAKTADLGIHGAGCS